MNQYLPKTNIAPAWRPSEKENPFSSPSVSGAMVGSGRVMFFTIATDEMMPIVFNLWFF